METTQFEQLAENLGYAKPEIEIPAPSEELFDWYLSNYGGLVGSYVKQLPDEDTRPYQDKHDAILFWLVDTGGEDLKQAQLSGNNYAVKNHLDSCPLIPKHNEGYERFLEWRKNS